MSLIPRKNRITFRPILGDIRLEERVVLSGTSTVSAVMAVQVSDVQAGGGTENTQAERGDLTTRQIRNAFRQQLGSAQTSLGQFVDNQATTLFNEPANFGSDGRPTPEALANFKANLAGALNAMTLRLSAQASLLPGSARRLVPNLQTSLLGSRNDSLVTRISNVIDSGRSLRSETLFRDAIQRQINGSFNDNTARLANFLSTTPLNRMSIDPTTGQQVPLAQFLRTQAINQVNNSFGTLANSVGPHARSALIDSTGVFNPQAVTGFQQQFSNALGTAAFQVGSLLSLFPDATTALGPQLQSDLFDLGINPVTGQPSSSFVSGMAALFPSSPVTEPLTSEPFTTDAFSTAFQNAFTTSFEEFSNTLNTFFGVLPPPGTGITFQLPAGFFQEDATFPNIFAPQFTSTNFNSGFNNGFVNSGSGFPGFGMPPTDFNTGFGTGFNRFTSLLNEELGITQPNFGTGAGVGIGPGVGV